MVRKKRQQTLKEEKTPEPAPTQPRIWLRADYITHTFHYRMPETVSISAVNPIIPSPLTVKMSLVASMLREGRKEDAEKIVHILPTLEVRIKPPNGAIVFKAFMRYTRVPAKPKKGQKLELDSVTGGLYGISPHIREYALWDESISIFVGFHEEGTKEVRELIKEALSIIPYLGSKDSLVTCVEIKEEQPKEEEYALKITSENDLLKSDREIIVRLAELIGKPTLMELLPTQREMEHYDNFLYSLPGGIKAKGKTKIYRR